jgi:hypothetical protein
LCSANHRILEEVNTGDLSSREIGKPQDWINLVLAALLIVSPWALGYVNSVDAARTAWASGIVIGFVAFGALLASWEEWTNLILGVWLIFAPWIVGFAGVVTAMHMHVAVGALLALFSAWELWAVHHETSAHA